MLYPTSLPSYRRQKTAIADTQWRLHRIPGLEFGLFALGRKRYAELFEEEENPPVRAALLDAHILMTEAKHFKNLHLQESRLRRQYQQDLQELKQLQAQRKEAEAQEAKGKSVALAQPNGFEFATIAQRPNEEDKKADHNKKENGSVLCTGSV